MLRFYDCAGFEPVLAVAHGSMLPSASDNSVGIRIFIISQLNGWPVCTPVNASPTLLPGSTHDSGAGRLARSFL